MGVLEMSLWPNAQDSTIDTLNGYSVLEVEFGDAMHTFTTKEVHSSTHPVQCLFPSQTTKATVEDTSRGVPLFPGCVTISCDVGKGEGTLPLLCFLVKGLNEL